MLKKVIATLSQKFLLVLAALLLAAGTAVTFVETPSASAASASCPPQISYGSTGSWVTKLQNDLKTKENANLTADGIFGPNTQSAVETWQSSHLSQVKEVDGIVGPLTWASLNECGSTSVGTVSTPSRSGTTAVGTVSTPSRSSTITFSAGGYTLTIEHADASLQTRVAEIESIFQHSYPKIVQRFALSPTTASKHVTLLFATTYNGSSVSFAETYWSQNLVVANPVQVMASPSGMGWVTHEFTHTVQKYSVVCGSGGNGGTDWVAESLATYGDWSYSPIASYMTFTDPRAPQSTDSYKEGYGIGARFFVWLQHRYSPSLPDQVNHGCQRGTTAESTLKSVTHKTVDQLWAEYAADRSFTIALPLNG
ncbi:hypothetical protein KSF_081450 [Reticulibacter mediterranei]|uniref:Peptidoglycan binding-like domain-containing protein n=1 Tax=Reticulibacter mediterranei TaxID=2778369 RepID=A0A8J3IWG7_9CHLR|nr:peptidoglycan-binding protein [Reticulibacter mediterranei]GHO98097.1 hypothetical protein KSF_081450 [Reticulibacter mediterranei]